MMGARWDSRRVAHRHAAVAARQLCVLVAGVVLLALTACAPTTRPNVLYQTSTITALLEGSYDGDLPLAALHQYGDLGLGTFNDIDGEMVMLDGKIYQIRSDGRAYRPDEHLGTPLAVVTKFTPQCEIEITGPLTYAEFQNKLDTLRTSPNVPCVFRIEGDFELVRTRSVPRQQPPYPRLAEVVKAQPTFDFPKASGTVVAFWVPQYMQTLNVPGYHFHFLTTPRDAGGHVLDLRPQRVKVAYAELSDMQLRLPQTASFRHAVLNEDRRKELHAVEQQTTTRPSK